MKKKHIVVIFFTVAVICAVIFIASPKTYIIATDDSFSPFCYLDGKGNPMGFDIDIINAVAEEAGIDIEIRAMGLIDGIDAVKNGKADGIIAALIPSDDLQNSLDFSDLYYNNEYAFAVKKGSNKRLLKKFNEGLNGIIENGVYDEICNKNLLWKYSGG